MIRALSITAALGGALTAGASSALAAPFIAGPVRTTLAPAQASGVIKGGVICVMQGPISPSEMERSFDPETYGALVQTGLGAADDPAAPVLVSASVTAMAIDVCMPQYGFDNVDGVKGEISLTVQWTLTDRATGASLGSATVQRTARRTDAAPGGLQRFLQEAFLDNLRQAKTSQAFQQAAGLGPLERPVPIVGKGGSAPSEPFIVQPWRVSTRTSPVDVSVGRRLLSDIGFNDPGRREETFRFHGAAGEIVTFVADRPVTLLVYRNKKPIGALLGRTGERALSVTLPADDDYLLWVLADVKPYQGPYGLVITSDRRPLAKPPEPSPVVAIAAQPTTPPPVPPVSPPSTPKLAAAPAAPPDASPPTGVPGIPMIEPRQPVRRPAPKGAKVQVEMFQFLAGFGSKVELSATGTGPLMLTLYTPAGAEMITVEASDKAVLEAYLPRDGLYFVGVASEGAYDLALAADEPPLPDAMIALDVGFETTNPEGEAVYTCWLEPGQKVRTTNKAAGVNIVGERDGSGHIRWDGTSQGTKVKFSVIHRLQRGYLISQSTATTQTKVEEVGSSAGGVWRGYRCPATP